ncbi:MAG: hypothetical protein Ta2G_15050 [Termitinemataceae bacterium]|nr:MAG: hypothetical protein Ta2G_15050 [Termitinemataceae bacterium]
MKTKIILTVLSVSLLFLFGCGSEEDILPPSTAKVVTDKNLSAKVKAPVLDALPLESFSAEQYNGSVRWYDAQGKLLTEGEKFSDSKVYRADVVLTTTSGWTLNGVAKNSFKHSGALKTVNPLNSGRVDIVFAPLKKANGTFDIPDNDDLKEKFAANSAEEFFDSLHVYINTEGTNLETDGFVKVGNYIDLPSLAVDRYNGAGGFAVTTATDDASNKKLRLLVVGINTYKGKNIPDELTEGVKNNNSPHVMFQFQNIPVVRRNEDPDTNLKGYLGSELRQYLISSTDSDGANRKSFLSSLNAAGVKAENMMEVTRKMSNSGIDTAENPIDLDTVTDKLFIPTEMEMFGEMLGASELEEEENQGLFSYYPKDDVGNTSRIKYFGSDARLYWTASPYYLEDHADSGYGELFMAVSTNGGGIALGYLGGVVPAFGIW